MLHYVQLSFLRTSSIKIKLDYIITDIMITLFFRHVSIIGAKKTNRRFPIYLLASVHQDYRVKKSPLIKQIITIETSNVKTNCLNVIDASDVAGQK